jgi:hypothetical protein
VGGTSGKKDDLVERLMEFLANPTVSDPPHPS